MSRKRTMHASADRDIDVAMFHEGRDYEQYIRPGKHLGRKLRLSSIPYNHVVTNEQVLEGLEWKSPIGLLKPLATTRGRVIFENVRYPGGYGWKEATLKSQLGVDYMALGPRVFVTPGISYC
jgi:hypothetical protein